MNSKDKILAFINSFDDWRGERLNELRDLINTFDLKEDYKWNVPVWSGRKLVCAISGHKEHVKINFFNGAHLPTQKYFNSGLDSKDHRSINMDKTYKLDVVVITQLLDEAMAYDSGKIS